MCCSGGDVIASIEWKRDVTASAAAAAYQPTVFYVLLKFLETILCLM